MSRDWPKEELNAASELMEHNGHMGFEKFCQAIPGDTLTRSLAKMNTFFWDFLAVFPYRIYWISVRFRANMYLPIEGGNAYDLPF